MFSQLFPVGLFPPQLWMGVPQGSPPIPPPTPTSQFTGVVGQGFPWSPATDADVEGMREHEPLTARQVNKYRAALRMELPELRFSVSSKFKSGADARHLNRLLAEDEEILLMLD